MHNEWISVKVNEYWPRANSELINWLFNNTVGGFDPVVGYIRFELESDAIFFKLGYKNAR